jgi:hypothetical protein
MSAICRAVGRDFDVAQLTGKEYGHTGHAGLGRHEGFELEKIVS